MHPRTYVIAEAGVNHNGSLDLARRMCRVARDAGCDAVKFQTFRAEAVVTARAAKAAYQEATTGGGSQLEMIRALELPWAAFEELHAECGRLGIAFLSTAFDLDSLARLDRLGVTMHKVPSGEITNLPFLRGVGRCAKPVLLSTGMSGIGEVDEALDALGAAGVGRERVTVLHCNTEYPTPMEDANLRALATLREALGVRVGYSDHTLGIEAAVAAVALGASVIEKHFTTDRNLPGPDQKASLEPADLQALVHAVRNVERALGDGVKRPSRSETGNRPIARRSIVAARAIRAGETLDESNLAAKRPGTGVSPMRWDEFVGRTARRDYAADEMIDP